MLEDSKANIGDIVGQNYINFIDKTNTGIYRIGYPPEKNKLELTGIGRHIEYSFKDKEAALNNIFDEVIVSEVRLFIKMLINMNSIKTISEE